MFDQLIDKYVGQAKPALASAGVTAQTYAERIISRLDEIIGALESESYYERRMRVTQVGPTGTLNDISTWTQIVSVPVGQEWELELFNLYVPGGGAATAAIGIDGISVLTANVAAGNAGSSQVGSNLHLYGGDNVYVFMSAASSLYLQFKVKRKEPAQRGHYAGDVVREPDRLDFRQESQLDRRHFSDANLSEGVNPVGERPANADNTVDALG